MDQGAPSHLADGVFTPADEVDSDSRPAYFYRNPSRINGIGDPFIIRDVKSGRYTAIATSASIGYYGWPSDDLVNWGTRSFVYKRPEDAWSTDSYWAPEVIYYRDRYYMFYTARNKQGRLLISVAAANAAEGPYTDLSDGPIFDPGYAIIDASVFVDDDGVPYMYYSRDCSENIQNGQAVSEVYGVRLQDDLLAFDGQPVLLTRPDQPWENPTGQTVWNEGPILLKHGGLYYLAYSANFFASPAYSVGYAVSSSPLGPFAKAEENPILAAGQLEGISGSGHHSYVSSPDGSELFAAYHTHTTPQAPSGNRQLCLDRTVFTEDGKLAINGPTLSWQPAPSGDRMRTLTLDDFAAGDDDTIADSRLFDSLQSIHASDKDRDVELAVGENGMTELRLSLSGQRTIAALVLAGGSKYQTNIAGVTLRIGSSEYQIGPFLPEGPESQTLAGTLDAGPADEVVFIFEARDPSLPVTLSEISLIESLEAR